VDDFQAGQIHLFDQMEKGLALTAGHHYLHAQVPSPF
jgi:hypothetical protein